MCFILFAVPALALAEGAPSYDALLSQLKSGFTDIDYGRLRQAYAATPGYDPYFRGDKDGKSLSAAAKTGNCSDVIAAANRLLDAKFTDISAHVYIAECARKMKDQSTANFHRKVAAGLLASIAHSGDGQTPQSAYVVIAVDEEYAFLSARGYQVAGQSLVQFGEHECDALDVVDESGARTTVYFNVDRPWAWLAQKFPPHAGDKPTAGK